MFTLLFLSLIFAPPIVTVALSILRYREKKERDSSWGALRDSSYLWWIIIFIVIDTLWVGTVVYLLCRDDANWQYRTCYILLGILADDARPVFVFAPADRVLGYVFCVFEETKETASLRPVRTLYIDDLCVDETARGQRIGQRLYDRAVRLARDSGCARVTLHAWNFNEKAFGFYQKLGMTPLYTTMEQRL